MLYDSTRSLLVSILGSLGSGDDNRWEDQTESGNALLYEMHQMSGSLSSPYRPDKRSKATSFSESQSSVAGKLTRAIPHVKEMVIAIRHKDQIQALDSGRAALAEMNGTHVLVISEAASEVTGEVTVVPPGDVPL
jgi:hypothetical protein